MKISLIYDFLTESGGLEKEMANHAKMLREEGFDVEVLTYDYTQEAIQRAGFDVPIRRIPAIRTRYEFLNIFLSVFLSFLGIYTLKGKEPDVYITYSFPANFLIREKKAKKINFLNHYPHFIYLNNKEKIEWAMGTNGMKRWVTLVLSWFLGDYFKKIDAKLVKNSDLNFSNSNFTKKVVDQIYGINSVVSYPPISSSFKPSDKKLSDKYIFVAGRIIPDKKLEWLIESCRYMKNKLPIFASGDCLEDYKKKLLKLAKKNKVDLRFVDKSREMLVPYYTNAQVFAFPTPGEDFGLVPAESLSCGVPVIAWDDGAGPTEQVINGVNGFLAEPYDVKDFGKKLDLAIDLKLKEKNYRKILDSSKKFSYDYLKKDFVKEVKKVLNSP